MMPSPQNTDFSELMRRGQELHQGGKPELALPLFEQALAMQADSADAANACATVLYDLQRPQAAYALLAQRSDVLLRNADAACNLAVLAEECGKAVEAKAAYDAALALDASHLRALNNRALLAGREGDWATAVQHMGEAARLAPQEPALQLNFIDMLTGAREYPAALEKTKSAIAAFGPAPELRLRMVALLSFMGEFEAAEKEFAQGGVAQRQLLAKYLDAAMGFVRDGAMNRAAKNRLDPYELFAAQAYEAMQDCDWRNEESLLKVVRRALAEAGSAPAPLLRDWRDLQFYSMMLPWSEEEQSRLWHHFGMTIQRMFKGTIAPLQAPTVRTQAAPLRIGIGAQALSSQAYRHALRRQLSLHDRERFSFYIYSPGPNPDPAHAQELKPWAAQVVEIGHLSDLEAAARIRLDQLDLWLDNSIYTTYCRVEPVPMKVAAVHSYSNCWQRHHTPSLFDYTMGDAFTHPDMGSVDYGAVVRFPGTCWLAANEDPPGAATVHSASGIPADALVLCAIHSSAMIDPETFALWMRVLQALNHAVLLLPALTARAQANLHEAARAAQVDSRRLHFLPHLERPELLAQIGQTDLFLDTLRFNANHVLVDALRMGVPAVSCAGHNMASRLGGSIIRAAGLPDCVVESQQAYFDKVVQLGSQPAELAALKARLASGLPGSAQPAPLFDTAARVREWESAWVTMVERQRAGLPPAAFDVPAG